MICYGKKCECTEWWEKCDLCECRHTYHAHCALMQCLRGFFLILSVFFNYYCLLDFIMPLGKTGISGFEWNLCIDISGFAVRLSLWNITPYLTSLSTIKTRESCYPSQITSSLSPAQSTIIPLFVNYNTCTQIEPSNHSVSQSLELVVLREWTERNKTKR